MRNSIQTKIALAIVAVALVSVNAYSQDVNKEKEAAQQRMNNEAKRADNRGDQKGYQDAAKASREIDKAETVDRIREVEKEYNRGGKD